MKNKLYSKVDIPNVLGLFSIGLVSIGYIIFFREFAELNIKFPFLSFPIFVGEFLLIFCAVMFFLGFITNIKKLNNKFLIIASLYFLFVIFKAFYGYLNHGVLALRHSALFYYPFFAVLGYVFYRKEYFVDAVKVLLSAFIIYMFYDGRYNTYWVVTCLILVLILALSCKKLYLKLLLISFLLILVPYRDIFASSRAGMLGNYASIFFIAFSSFFIFKIPKTLKIISLICFIVLFVVGMNKYTDKNALKFFMKFEHLKNEFISYDSQIEQESVTFNQEELGDAKLFFDGAEQNKMITEKRKFFSQEKDLLTDTHEQKVMNKAEVVIEVETVIRNEFSKTDAVDVDEDKVVDADVVTVIKNEILKISTETAFAEKNPKTDVVGIEKDNDILGQDVVLEKQRVEINYKIEKSQNIDNTEIKKSDNNIKGFRLSIQLWVTHCLELLFGEIC